MMLLILYLISVYKFLRQFYITTIYWIPTVYYAVYKMTIFNEKVMIIPIFAGREWGFENLVRSYLFKARSGICFSLSFQVFLLKYHKIPPHTIALGDGLEFFLLIS